MDKNDFESWFSKSGLGEKNWATARAGWVGCEQTAIEKELSKYKRDEEIRIDAALHASRQEEFLRRLRGETYKHTGLRF